jgi:kinesin family protein C2/C3
LPASADQAKVDALQREAIAIKEQVEAKKKEAADKRDAVTAYREAAAKARQAEVVEYRKLEKERRVIYNELQELRGNLRVYCRLRPRMDPNIKEYVSPVDDITLRIVDPTMETAADYEFDLILPESATQENVFSEVHPLVASVLDGYNVCVFAYGQTGSGKTHTMEGTPQDRGISFRTLSELFSAGLEREAEGYSTVFLLSVLEVYNDKIFDLLDGRKPAAARWGGKEVGVVVQPQKLTPVKSVEEVEMLLSSAYVNRSVAGTDCNQHSSRSHCLLTIHVVSENVAAKAKLTAKLHLIDLAGSERVKNSGVEGMRFKEATHINTSLTHLKSVIQALAQKNDGHVPFRNSALTSLLQDSLGGNCKCLMFANVSVLAGNVPETICTLKYASEARKVVVGKVTAKVTKTEA